MSKNSSVAVHDADRRVSSHSIRNYTGHGTIYSKTLRNDTDERLVRFGRSFRHRESLLIIATTPETS